MGGRLNFDGGTLTLDGGKRPPYNLSTGYNFKLRLLFNTTLTFTSNITYLAL